MKLFVPALLAVLGLCVIGCDDKVYEKKVEQKDADGDTVHKSTHTVTQDDEGNTTEKKTQKNVD